MATFYWDQPDDPAGNVQHIARHGVTIDEVEDVLSDPASATSISRSSGRPSKFGYMSARRYLAVVWEATRLDPRGMRPITAFEVSKPRKPRRS